MRKWIPIAIAALVAVNLVIFQRTQLAEKEIQRNPSAPRLLPSMADAKPLQPDMTASRIESYNDTGFILTGQPTRPVSNERSTDTTHRSGSKKASVPTEPNAIQQVNYLEAQRSARQQQQSRSRHPATPRQSAPPQGFGPPVRNPSNYGPVPQNWAAHQTAQQSAQAMPQRATREPMNPQKAQSLAKQLQQLPPESDPAFYQAAMQLAHGNIPMDQLARLHAPGPYQPPPHDGQRYQQWPQHQHQLPPGHVQQGTNQSQRQPAQASRPHQYPAQIGPHRQAPPQRYRQQTARASQTEMLQQYPVRLAQSQAEVENLLLGNPEVPPPPGFKPPATEAIKAIQTRPATQPANVPQPTNTQPTAPPSAAGGQPNPATNPTQSINNTGSGLRFPDQSPGEYATSVQSKTNTAGANPTGANTGAADAANTPAQVEQVPKPGEKMPVQDNLPAPNTDANAAAPSGNGTNNPYQPAPDENLLQQNPQGVPSQGAPTNDGGTNAQSESGQPGSEQSGSGQPAAQNQSPTQQTPATQNKASAAGGAAKTPTATSDDPHYDVFANSQFPSARECGECHKQIFEEWSVSNHAYAAISPMFHRFEQTINSLARGTIGYFCMRCHATVATTLNHPREKSIWESIPAAHEGVTCITCHRVREHYGKANGDRRIEPGDIFEPVFGSGYGEKLREIISKKEHYKVKTEHGAKGPGQKIHTKVIHFEQISESDFCVSCHQVAVYPGIALEVVWAQYRASPACKEGISCQDCHMGSVPGKPYGYDTAPVAVVGGKEIDPGRKHSNHMFVGPGYSIAHPGLFPFRNKKVDDEDWTPHEWNQFDYRAGWGTEDFEKAVEDGHVKAYFPEVWENSDDRADARELIDKNLDKLAEKKRLRKVLMEKSSEVVGPIFRKQPRVGKRLNFKYQIKNISNGHNMPSGSLGAQPQLWVNVALTGPDGRHLWESGYVDCNGDIADLHSMEVAKGRIKRDQQLVNFQTKFLILGAKGPDREMYLPIPVDQDQLPFIRPAGLPITVLNHPPTIRMEAHSVPPLGAKEAKYHVPANLMTRPGVYQLHIRLRSRAEPIYFMRFCRATPEMERRMNERMLSFHEQSTSFVVQ